MSTETADSRSVDARAICLFYGVAFGLNWLLALPLWCSGKGLHTPLVLWLLPLMMLTPSIGVVAVWIFMPRSIQPIITVTGLGVGQWPKALPYWLFGWCGITALVLAAPLVGAFLGMYTLDLQNFSGLRRLLRQQPGSEVVLQTVSFQTLLLIQFAQLLIAPGINAVFAFGEEWGWRGFLLSKLIAVGATACALLEWSVVGSLAHAGDFARIQLPVTPTVRCPLNGHFLCDHGSSFRLDATSDRKHLARCYWPWRAKRGWRIWLCICQCGPDDRYRPRHYLGLDRMDFARTYYLPVDSPKTLASLQAALG